MDSRMDDPTYCPLEVLVKPERLAEFRRDIYDNCSDEWIPDYTRHFLCRSCCAQHNKHDQKTPLLFKLEAYEKCMTALSSKTYAMVQTDGKEKVASKGIQKKALLFKLGDAVNEAMEGCLQQGVDTQITNTSFRLHKGSIHTVQQSKSAFKSMSKDRYRLMG